MCTAIGWQGRHFMFGRNLDLEYGFHERVTQVARGSLLRFAAMPPVRTAYAMLGMAAEDGGFPLFAEAVNEQGLCAAGLYFPHSARMRAAGDMRKGERAAEERAAAAEDIQGAEGAAAERAAAAGRAVAPHEMVAALLARCADTRQARAFLQGAEGAAAEKAAAAGDIQGAEGAAAERAAAVGRAIAPHEMVAALLAHCADTRQARAFLQGAEVVSIPYKNYPVPALHWLVADRYGCFVAEPAEGGLRLYDDPAGVLANEPPFPFQLHNLHAYRHLTAAEPACGFGMPLKALYHGTGGVGLPGDAASPSRFVRAAFYRANSRPFAEAGEGEGRGEGEDEADVAEQDAAQMFHMLSAVEMVRGGVLTEEGSPCYTRYACCIDADAGVYYLKRYGSLGAEKFTLHRQGAEEIK